MPVAVGIVIEPPIGAYLTLRMVMVGAVFGSNGSFVVPLIRAVPGLLIAAGLTVTRGTLLIR